VAGPPAVSDLGVCVDAGVEGLFWASPVEDGRQLRRHVRGTEASPAVIGRQFDLTISPSLSHPIII